MSAGNRALAADDPTGTQARRSSTASSFNRRWRELRGNFRDELSRNALLRPDTNRSDARKVSEFRFWLDREIDGTVVEPAPPGAVLAGNHYTGQIVYGSHVHGILLGNAHLKREGGDVGGLSHNQAEILARSQPHQEYLEFGYESVYDDLVDAGNHTHAEASKAYRSKIASGAGMGAILTGGDANDGVNNTINSVGAGATTRIANDAVVVGVNTGALLYYAGEGVERVSAVPEFTREEGSGGDSASWSTAEDPRVCQQCNNLAGSTYLISDILRGDAPMPVQDTHSFCRCYYLPVT